MNHTNSSCTEKKKKKHGEPSEPPQVAIMSPVTPHSHTTMTSWAQQAEQLFDAILIQYLVNLIPLMSYNELSDEHYMIDTIPTVKKASQT